MLVEQPLQQPIVGAEVVPPFRDAMRLVDREQGKVGFLQQLGKAFGRRPLGRGVEQVELPVAQRVADCARILAGAGQRGGTDAEAFGAAHLVLHQRNQREMTMAVRAGPARGADSKRFARPGRHHGEVLTPRHGPLHDPSCTPRKWESRTGRGEADARWSQLHHCGGSGRRASLAMSQRPAKDWSMTVRVDMGVGPRGDPVSIDLEELLATRLLVQGNSGSGKSHLLRRLLERSAGQVQQVVIDPEGDFVTLADRYGHVPVEAADHSERDIARLASRIREHRASVVLSLEGLEAEGQMRCAAALGGLFDAPRDRGTPLVVVDEAQLFAPAGGGEVAEEVRASSPP